VRRRALPVPSRRAGVHTFIPRQVRSHEHLGFACNSKEELLERDAAARAVGAKVANPMTEFTGKEGWLLEVHDPDGNAIEWTCGWVSEVKPPEKSGGAAV